MSRFEPAEIQRLPAFIALHRWEHFGVASVLHLAIRHKVCVAPAVTHYNFTDSHTDWSLENRTIINKGVKFAIFTAGIDIGRQLAQQLFIVLSANKTRAGSVFSA